MKKSIIILLGLLLMSSFALASVNLSHQLFHASSLDTDGTDQINSSDFVIQGSPNHLSIGCKHAGCYEFYGGPSDYLEGADADYRATDTWTVSLWLYIDSSIDGSDRIAMKDMGGTDYKKMYLLMSADAASITLGGYSGSCYVDISGPITKEEWHHVVVSSGDSASATKLYIDGELVGSNSACHYCLQAPGYPFLLGGAKVGDPMFEGKIDEFVMWKRVLTDDSCSVGNNCSGEIAELYDNGLGKFYPFQAASISNINCTSCNPPNGDTTPPYTTSDTTPTFAFITDFNTWCRIGKEDVSYTSMGSSRQCQSGEGSQSHICTLTVQDMLYNETDYVYIKCITTSEEESTSGALEMTINDTDVLVESALLNGIYATSIWPGAKIYSNQQVYVRDINNNHALGTFEKVAAYGTQRWAFNFIGDNENHIGTFYNLSPVFYFMEMANLTGDEIMNHVSGFINSTKI